MRILQILENFSRFSLRFPQLRQEPEGFVPSRFYFPVPGAAVPDPRSSCGPVDAESKQTRGGLGRSRALPCPLPSGSTGASQEPRPRAGTETARRSPRCRGPAGMAGSPSILIHCDCSTKPRGPGCFTPRLRCAGCPRAIAAGTERATGQGSSLSRSASLPAWQQEEPRCRGAPCEHRPPRGAGALSLRRFQSPLCLWRGSEAATCQ